MTHPNPWWEHTLNWSMHRCSGSRCCGVHAGRQGWWYWEVDTGKPNRIVAEGHTLTRWGARRAAHRAMRALS